MGSVVVGDEGAFDFRIDGPVVLDSLVDWANSLDKKLFLLLSLFSFPMQRFNILEIIVFRVNFDDFRLHLR